MLHLFKIHYLLCSRAGRNNTQHIELPSVQLQRRFEKFLANAANGDKVY